MSNDIILGYCPCVGRYCDAEALVKREKRPTAKIYLNCPKCRYLSPRSDESQEWIIDNFIPKSGDDRPKWEILGLEPPSDDDLDDVTDGGDDVIDQAANGVTDDGGGDVAKPPETEEKSALHSVKKGRFGRFVESV